MKWLALSVLCVTISCAGAPPAGPTSVSDVSAPAAVFAGYRTFSFGDADPPREGYQVSPHSLEVQQRLVPLVEAAFVERGYAKAPEAGDFIVKLASGTMPGDPPADAIDGERRFGTPPQGFIGIDVYDAKNRTEIWQGTAFAEIAMDKIDERLLARGVARMLATFPKPSVSTPSPERVSVIGPPARTE